MSMLLTASGSSSPLSADIEAVARAEEFCAPIIPVRHTDLKALVRELDHTRAALEHRGLSEAELERLIQPYARKGEPYSMTACRVIRDQLDEMHSLEQRAVDAEKRVEELEHRQCSEDTLDETMRLLGFGEN